MVVVPLGAAYGPCHAGAPLTALCDPGADATDAEDGYLTPRVVACAVPVRQARSRGPWLRATPQLTRGANSFGRVGGPRLPAAGWHPAPSTQAQPPPTRSSSAWSTRQASRRPCLALCWWHRRARRLSGCVHRFAALSVHCRGPHARPRDWHERARAAARAQHRSAHRDLQREWRCRRPCRRPSSASSWRPRCRRWCRCRRAHRTQHALEGRYRQPRSRASWARRRRMAAGRTSLGGACADAAVTCANASDGSGTLQLARRRAACWPARRQPASRSAAPATSLAGPRCARAARDKADERHLATHPWLCFFAGRVGLRGHQRARGNRGCRAVRSVRRRHSRAPGRRVPHGGHRTRLPARCEPQGGPLRRFTSPLGPPTVCRRDLVAPRAGEVLCGGSCSAVGCDVLAALGANASAPAVVAPETAALLALVAQAGQLAQLLQSGAGAGSAALQAQLAPVRLEAAAALAAASPPGNSSRPTLVAATCAGASSAFTLPATSPAPSLIANAAIQSGSRRLAGVALPVTGGRESTIARRTLLQAALQTAPPMAQGAASDADGWLTHRGVLVGGVMLRLTRRELPDGVCSPKCAARSPLPAACCRSIARAAYSRSSSAPNPSRARQV